MRACLLVLALIVNWSLAQAGFAADRTALTNFANAFKAGDIGAMQQLMDDSLRADLDAQALTKLRGELLGDAKEFRDVEVTRGRYFVGSVRLVGFQAKTRHVKHVVRLSEGGDGKFDGLDVVLDDHESERPKSEWCFGSLISRYAAATGVVEVAPVGVDGAPLPHATVTLWHAIDADPKHSWAWRDPANGQWWESIFHSADSPRTFDHLEAGTYGPVVEEDRGKGYVGVGNLITVDPSQTHQEIRVAVAQGGRLEVRCVDAESGGEVPELYVTAEPVDHPIWEKPQFPFRSEAVEGRRSVFVFPKLPAAKLRVLARRQASDPGDTVYEAVPAEVEIRPGETTNVELKITQRRMTKTEIDQRWPWEVYGRVTDPGGAAVKGVIVRAYAGLATMRRTGTALTNAEGEYRLRFSQGFLAEEPLVHSVLIGADIAGMYETNLNQQGQVAAAEPNAKYGRENYRLNQIVEQGTPKRLDFVMAQAGHLVVRVRADKGREKLLEGVQISLKGEVMPPGCSVVDGGRVAGNAWKEFSDVPLDREWYLEIAWGERETVRTQPFRLTEPKNYAIGLDWRKDATGLDVLEIVSLKDAFGRNQISELVGNDPLTHPPAPAAEQEEAQEWLRQIAAANRDWLDAPSPAVKSFSYDFVMRDEPAQKYVVDRQRRVAGVVLQGIAFVSAAESLTKNFRNIVFRQIDRGEDRITLSCTLLEPRNLSAGNGVLGSYHGFFRMNFRDGTLSFDPRTYQVLECRTKDVREKFGDYFEVAEGRHVPRSIEIYEGEELRHRWKFAVYEPGLWLFDESVAPRPDEAPYQVRIENVSINGAAALQRTAKVSAPTN